MQGQSCIQRALARFAFASWLAGGAITSSALITGAFTTGVLCWGASDAAAQTKPAKQVELRWKGKAYASDKAPAELDAAARNAWKAWSAWAHEHEYKLELTNDQHLLLVYPKQQSSASADLERIDAAAQIFERLAPLPDRKAMPGAPVVSTQPAASDKAPATDKGAAKGTKKSTAAPTSPGSSPSSSPPNAPAGTSPSTHSSSSSDDNDGLPEGLSASDLPAVDSETAVLFKARTVDDYEAVVHAVVKQNELLKHWEGDALLHHGFVLPDPLCAAWVSTGAPGMEEWSPDAEMVHRVAQLLLVRRYGPLPWWITVGVAWNVEMEQQGAIYCFPYRDGFVGVGEHTDWDKNLGNAFKSRKKDPVQDHELCGFVRGKFDSGSAELAWGTAAYLATQKPGALSLVLADMRRARIVNGRVIVDADEGTWKLPSNFELSASDQIKILRARAGASVMNDLSAWFAQGLPNRKPGGKK